jgi:hypothetical protein
MGNQMGKQVPSELVTQPNLEQSKGYKRKF